MCVHCSFSVRSHIVQNEHKNVQWPWNKTLNLKKERKSFDSHFKLEKTSKTVGKAMLTWPSGYVIILLDYIPKTNDVSSQSHEKVTTITTPFKTWDMGSIFLVSPGSVSAQTLVSEERCSPPPARCNPAVDESPAPCTLWCHRAADRAAALLARNSACEERGRYKDNI